MYIEFIKPRTVEALYIHTHTIDLVKNNRINRNKKGNIILSGGFTRF